MWWGGERLAQGMRDTVQTQATPGRLVCLADSSAHLNAHHVYFPRKGSLNGRQKVEALPSQLRKPVSNHNHSYLHVCSKFQEPGHTQQKS